MFRCACAGGKRATLLAVGKRRLLGANARSESGWGRGGCQPAWHGVVPLSTNDRLPRDTSLRLALMLRGNQCVESCDTTGGGRASVWQSGDGGGGGGDGGTSGVWHKEEEGRVTVGGKRVVGGPPRAGIIVKRFAATTPNQLVRVPRAPLLAWQWHPQLRPCLQAPSLSVLRLQSLGSKLPHGKFCSG